MTERPVRTVSYSRAQQVHIISPADVNSSYTLFGGMLMQWIDIVAGVVARRHSGFNVRTAAVDHLSFIAPAYINDIVTIDGRITFVGTTSMEICVDTFVERMSCPEQRLHVNRAYLTMVAVDHDGNPTQVPALKPETEAEKADYEAGMERRALRHRTQQAY
ncbi:MAG: acyl-CoA thioesterase [Clostridia bacterium]|nr:acyl-CoA thioesterase [Clostridia bacterium]